MVPSADPQLIEAKQLVSRKKQQLVHLEAYDEAVVDLKAKVKEIEGQDMREAIQDKVGGLGQFPLPACWRLCRDGGLCHPPSTLFTAPCPACTKPAYQHT